MGVYERALKLPSTSKESFFLWGLRQTGKSSLLKARYPHSVLVNLLRASERIPLESNPSLLREQLLANPTARKYPVILDEVQKVPALLDEVHSLIEDEGMSFGLCGSSARKLKRGHANLLGGRALRFELVGLSAIEVGEKWDLNRMLNHGYLPRMYDHENAKEVWRSYIQDYLKEEILEEGLVRTLPPFARFLEISSLSDTQAVSWETFARDVGVSSEGIKGYFEILVDTHVGTFVPAFQKRPKRRTRAHPKFYFTDVGLVNQLAKRGYLEPGSELYGKAFENWVFHELLCYKNYVDRDLDIHYWGLTSGAEVDFILNAAQCAIDVKASDRIHSEHLKGLLEFSKEYPNCKKRLVISLESKDRFLDNGIEILTYRSFIDRLWNNTI